jgi:hypothetical protein
MAESDGTVEGHDEAERRGNVDTVCCYSVR